MEDDGSEREDAKWYHYREDLKEFSKGHKNVVFKISGEGEGYGEEIKDIWIEYIMNGMHQRCEDKISFDEFDEKKLEL